MAVLNNTQVLGFPDYEAPTRRLAAALNLPFGLIDIHHFPDLESKVTLPEPIAEHVILCRSLNTPNDKLIELILASDTARKLGAREITLVAPYLCYMRQDKAFHPGEAISQKIIGKLLAEHINALITVDPHLHRVHRLDEAIPLKHSMTLHATGPMASFLAQEIPDAFLIGPDWESRQWVSEIADQNHLDYVIASKTRRSDHDVSIQLPEADYRDRNIVLVDDIASSGYTLEMTARALAEYQPASIRVVITHALIDDSACTRLTQAGIDQIWSTDSILHPTNHIPLADLLADGVNQLLADMHNSH
jgi:ribose-phosphate pyrophosphokinase